MRTRRVTMSEEFCERIRIEQILHGPHCWAIRGS